MWAKFEEWTMAQPKWLSSLVITFVMITLIAMFITIGAVIINVMGKWVIAPLMFGLLWVYVYFAILKGHIE